MVPVPRSVFTNRKGKGVAQKVARDQEAASRTSLCHALASDSAEKYYEMQCEVFSLISLKKASAFRERAR